MLIALVGPMSGIEEYNYPRFFATEMALQQEGHDVINPATNLPHPTLGLDGPWDYFMRQAITNLTLADGICLLEGWRQSTGANLEVHIAKTLGLPLYRWDGCLKPLYTIVGLSGYGRSGKDTVAGMLAGYGYQRVSFADVLREALLRLDPVVDNVRGRSISQVLETVDYDAAKVIFPEVRRMLQVLGTEVGRNMLGPDVWVDAVLNNLEDGGKYVISDCRFPNEAAAVKRLGGEMWRISRTGIGPVNDHISEISLDDWEFDCMIENDGTLRDLHDVVSEMMDEVEAGV